MDEALSVFRYLHLFLPNTNKPGMDSQPGDVYGKDGGRRRISTYLGSSGCGVE